MTLRGLDIFTDDGRRL
ncbi:hypothetical protein [Common midwife toad virus]|uniref:Uncharacterized protein n=1 Tax=Common midwife toad virus TaxID=540070 RepID=A0A2D0XMS2_9VIRU|nr:hypothetical protein [Common midwife toad virus]